MPLGIGIGQIVALVRETRVLERSPEHLSVSGPNASSIAAALAEGGDASAIRVDGDPTRAALAIRVVEGAVSPAEQAVHRRIVRLGKPLLVLRYGDGNVPYALPGDILDVTQDVPLDALAAAIAGAAPDAAPALASRLPVLRPAVQRHLVGVSSWGNALIAGSWRDDGPQLPLLTLAQSRMLLLLAVSRGRQLPHHPQEVARVVGPSLGAALAVGVGARALVRRLPVRGPLVRAVVAYAGTRALGAVRLP